MNHTIRALLAAALLAAPVVVRAQDAPEKGGPCRADAQKFCADVKPGGGAIIKCLQEHAADLSPECKAQREKVKARMEKEKADFDASCGADQAKLCKDVQPGRGALLRCLRDNKDQLSESCKGFMAQKRRQFERRHPRMTAELRACRADRKKFCGDVKPGQGAIVDCMKQHESELSDACRTAMGRNGQGGEDQGGQPEGKPD